MNELTNTFRRTTFSRLFSALASGLLVGLALPPWGWWPLAFVGSALFFIITRSVNNSRQHFALGCAFGIGWLALGMGWMWFLTAPGYILATLLFASFHGLAAVIASRIGSSIISRPIAHTLAEALRFSIPFGGVPLATLPIAISPTRLADIVSIGGPILATWFVLQLAALVVVLINTNESRRVIAVVAMTLIAMQTLGQIISPVQTANSTLRIALVQGGGPQGVLAINATARDAVDRHLAVTNSLQISDNLDVVVWPENVIDVADFAASREYTEISAQAKRLNAEFVVGITEDAGPGRFTNAQIVVQPNGNITSRYDKVRRVPFGEYVPASMRSALSAVGAPMDRIPSDAVQGTDPALLNLRDTNIAVTISWESFFAGRANSGVEAGGTILINPTNGSSYTGTILQTQQLATNTLRARETGRWTLQVATTGFSAVISPDGKITQRVAIGKAQAIIVEVPLRTGRTLYSHLGDAPFIVALVIGLLVCVNTQRRLRISSK
ncbi:MAG: apolipoprotein N-acyltransferase [Acidimicrobiaceae bacterium]|nr:apolipoprotein N-acyltransferase [Acidimicrobiaceae bacterium]